MSITKQISSYPSTGRGFAINHNFLYNISGIILTKRDFRITPSQLLDDSYLFSAMENGDIFPLHMIQDVIPENEDALEIESIRGNTYPQGKGVYRHVLKFNWTLEFHKIVETYSGTDLYAIYYDSNRHIILTEESEGVYRGLTTNMIHLLKPDMFTNGSQVSFSDLKVELSDPKEITEKGKSIQLDWLPSAIDKVFVSLRIESTGTDYVNFRAKHNTNDINGISVSDVSLIDNSNGNLPITLVSNLGGVYKVRVGGDLVTSGCLIVNSSTYLGQVRYVYQQVIQVINSFILENLTDNFIYEDGDNIIFEN